MKKLLILSAMCLLFLSPYSGVVFSKDITINLANRIEGQVYDSDHIPVADAYVELHDDVDSLLSHTKTTSSGRFTFYGLSSGRFTIKVLPFGKNLLEQSQDVEIGNFRPSGSDTSYVEFYLRPDKRTTSIQNHRPEAIFVQDVPQDAQKLFKTGVDDLAKTPDTGLAEIEEAIKKFPDYFEALSRLGKEYVLRKDYSKAYPYLLKAIDLNPRSYSSYYALSFAFYQLKQIPAALAAAKATTILDPTSIEALLLCGTLYRLNENYEEAEKTLLKAESLAKKQNAEIYWQLGLLYIKLNRNKEAADKLEIYLKISPDSPDKKKVQELIAKLRNSKKN